MIGCIEWNSNLHLSYLLTSIKEADAPIKPHRIGHHDVVSVVTQMLNMCLKCLWLTIAVLTATS